MPLVVKAEPRPPVELSAAEQRIYNAYRDAFSGIGDINDTKTLRLIEQAINGGNPLGAVNGIAWGDFVQSLNKTVQSLTNEVVRSANASARTFPKTISIPANFTASDPRAIAFAQARAGKLIRQVSDETRKAVTETILEALRMRIDRREMVTRISKVVGLDSRQARALTRYYEKSLQDAQARGLDYDEAVAVADKLGEKYKTRLLKQRAVRIARTETLAASNAGRYLSWIEAETAGLLPPNSMKRWITAMDERTCPICAPLNNQEFPYKADFPTGELMPPVHPNCRCTAVIVPAPVTFIPPLVEKSTSAFYAMFKHGTHDQSTHNPHKGGGRREVGAWRYGGTDYDAEFAKLREAGILRNPDGVSEDGDPYILKPNERTELHRKGEPIPEGYEIVPDGKPSYADPAKYDVIRPATPKKSFGSSNEEDYLTTIRMEPFYQNSGDARLKNPALDAEIKDLEASYLRLDVSAAEAFYRQEARDKGLSGRNFDYYVTAQVSRARTYITTNNSYVRHEIAKRLDPYTPEPLGFFGAVDATRSTVIGNLERAFPVIAVDDDDILQVISDGRFKTQYETKDSNGAYMPMLRRTRESAYMGVPQGTPAAERPIYGYLAVQTSGKTPNTSEYNSDKWNVDNLEVGQYGDVRVVLKDSVIERTSYTIPDSLDGYALSRPLGEVHTPKTVGFAGLHHDLTFSHNGLQREGYAEAQVRGGVKLSDIKEIVVVPKYKGFEGEIRIEEHNPSLAEAITIALAAKGLDIPVTALKPKDRAKKK